MIRTSKIVFAALAMAAQMTAAVAQGLQAGAPPPPNEKPGYSSMICVWMIYRTAHAIGERCLHGEDTALQAALDHASERIETFLTENSPSDAAQLQALKEPMAAVPFERMCQPNEGPQFYETLRRRGAEQLVKGIDDWIAHPTKPPSACL